MRRFDYIKQSSSIFHRNKNLSLYFLRVECGYESLTSMQVPAKSLGSRASVNPKAPAAAPLLKPACLRSRPSVLAMAKPQVNAAATAPSVAEEAALIHKKVGLGSCLPRIHVPWPGDASGWGRIKGTGGVSFLSQELRGRLGCSPPLLRPCVTRGRVGLFQCACCPGPDPEWRVVPRLCSCS